MKQKRRTFLATFFTTLLFWCSLTGLAAVNYQLEFGGFEGFFDRYRIEHPEPLVVLVKSDKRQRVFSLEGANRIAASKTEYILLVPRPVRMTLTLTQKLRHELDRAKNKHTEQEFLHNALLY